METRPARTAAGPLSVVAIDQYEDRPVVHDELARRFLPIGARAVVALARRPGVRRWAMNTTEQKMPGMWASFLCRKRYIDERWAEATTAGIDTMVIFGAGRDTRAYRLPESAGIRVFEVDLPENVRMKRKLVRRWYGRVPDHIRLVAVDLETRDPVEALTAEGCPTDTRIFYVWEGVTPYLTEHGVRSTLAAVSRAASGSRMVFTHLPRAFIDGQELYGCDELYRKYRVDSELWRYGIESDDVAGLLAEYGWRVAEQPTAQDFTDRYLTPIGRELPVSELERSVYAQKIGPPSREGDVYGKSEIRADP